MSSSSEGRTIVIGVDSLDLLLVDLGIAPTRARAQALVLAGQVVVDDQRIDKPGTRVSTDAEVRLKGEPMPYVSRGGLKLEAALKHFQLDVRGAVCADIGASTGGFTDCLLQAGASRVYALDVGRNNCLSYRRLSLQIPPDRHRHHYVKAKVRVHEYPDGRLALFHGPRCLARYHADGRLIDGKDHAKTAA